MERSVYVLDANVFIEAARRYYAFDLGTKFWDILNQHAENGVIESIDRVKDELDKERDELARWADSNFSHAFCSTDQEDVIKSYAKVMTWVQAQSQFSDVAKADFAKGADGWLVAYAAAKGRTIVTHEVAAPDARRKVPIPNVCEPFHVRPVNTFVMLRELGARFT
jgi:hypothetical protein